MLNTIIAIITVFMTSGITGESVKVDTDKSSVVWHASKVTGKHDGTISISGGALEYKKKKLIGGTFTIDMPTISTTDLEGEWKQKLDGHLKSEDFFAVEKFKTATFTITDVKAKSGGKYDITGDLTIKGITQSVTFPATVTESGATAKITLDRTKFDIRYGSNSFFDNLGDKAIDDEFTLDVDLVLTK